MTAATATRPVARPSATELIPGDPAAIRAFARQIRVTGDDAVRPIAADQQRAETATTLWHGAGGDAARTRLQGSGQVWSTAAEVLAQLAEAVEAYAQQLVEAQRSAAEVVGYQDQAAASTWTAVAFWYHARAELTLRTAQVQLYFASTTLAAAFDQATATLPTLAPAPTTLRTPPRQTAPWSSILDTPQNSCGPDWVDPAAPWQAPPGSRYPYLPGRPWPTTLAAPNALSDLLFTRLDASPYQAGALTSLAKERGWGAERFDFVGANAEAEYNHKGAWAFVGAFDGLGVSGVGSSKDLDAYYSVGGILGYGGAYSVDLPLKGAIEPKLTIEGGVLHEAGGILPIRGKADGFGLDNNPALIGSAAFTLRTAVGGPTVGVEAGTLIHNDPGESCTYSIFVGVQPPVLGYEGHVGPAEISAGVWVGRGYSLTVPSAATTPWQCAAILPESLRNTLPWWSSEAHK